jgi:hypothetical protein
MNRRAILSLSATLVLGLFWSVFLFAALDLGLSELSDSILVFAKTVIMIVFAFSFHFIA